MSGLNVIVHQDLTHLRTLASQAFQQEVYTAKQTGSPVLILLSGGSAGSLVEGIEPSFWEGTTSIVLDERFSADIAWNNSLILQSKGVPISLTVPQENEPLEQFSDRYQALVQNWIDQHQHGVIIATGGMGNDGHFAGLSPFESDQEKNTAQELFLNTDRLVVGYTGHLVPEQRVTLTGRFIKEKIQVMIMYVVGEGKQIAINRLFSPGEPFERTPAVLLHEMTGRVSLYTDRRLPQP